LFVSHVVNVGSSVNLTVNHVSAVRLFTLLRSVNQWSGFDWL